MFARGGGGWTEGGKWETTLERPLGKKDRTTFQSSFNIEGLQVTWLFVSLGFQHLFEFLILVGNATVLPFMFLQIITWEMFLILHLLFSFFLFAFFCTVQSWKTWNVKCHRPWTVWIGGAVSPQSPSNSHIHTTLGVNTCSILACRAILQSLCFLSDKHHSAFLQHFGKTWWFYMIFIEFQWSFVMRWHWWYIWECLKKYKKKRPEEFVFFV